ncbi:MAG: CdaR family protein [Ardenticatenia bacterium]|nr:CdaR family protein [Ardenticatenia bacterium]
MRLRQLLSNLSSFLLALFLGVIIWAVAINSENPLVVRTFPEQIPVDLINVPPGLVPLTGEGESVRLQVRAPRQWWNQVERSSRRTRVSKFRAWVDLSGLSAGLYELDVNVEKAARADREVRILATTPEKIPVRLDRVEEREMSVDVDIIDRSSVPTGYEIQTPQAEPPVVRLRGPTSRLDRVDRVVARVQVNGARAPVQVEAPLVLVDRQGELVPVGSGSVDVQLEPRRVVVTVPIRQRQGYRELIVRPIIVGEPAPGYWVSDIDVVPQTISVVGLPAAVERLSPIVETEPIDVTGLTAGTLIRDVEVLLPEDVSPLEGNRLVQVRIAVQALKSSAQVAVRPTWSGLAAGFAVTQITPEQVDVIVEGPVNELEELRPSDVFAVLDLTGLQPGTHLVSPRVSVPGSLTVASVLPRQVEVVIGLAQTSRLFVRPVDVVGSDKWMQYTVAPPTVTVTLEGSSLLLAELDEEDVTVTVNVEGRPAGTYFLTPTVQVLDTLAVAEIVPPQVQVSVEPALSTFTVTRRLAWRGLEPGMILYLEPREVTLELRAPGNPEVARQALVDDPTFRVFVDVDGLPAGSYTLTPQVSLPARYELVRVVPEQIQARLSPLAAPHN